MKSHLLKSSLYAIKIIFICIFSLFLNNKIVAQSIEETTLSKVNLYADIGAHFGAQASINIESQIYSGNKLTWYARGGIGASGVIMATGGPGGLAAITMLTGKGNKHFELNIGAFVGKDIELEHIYVWPLIDFGYRYQKPEGGLIFKVKVGFLGLGIGLGYAF